MQQPANHFPAALLAAVLIWLWLANHTLLSAAGDGEARPTSPIDYLEPKFLAGTIYADADAKKVLFTFRRTAAGSNSTVRVLREYILPDGSLAATERIVYDSGKLISYQLEELQSGASAKVVVRPNPRSQREQRIVFEYSQGATKKTDSEKLQPDTFVNDMVAPYIVAHWAALTNGSTMKLRLVAPLRTETVGFKLVKESETTLGAKPVVIIKMEPTSLILARFIDPILFTVEKNEPHRVLQYSGRTTPRIQKKGNWEDLDALAVFDWK